jgi:hypothetical protein
MEPGELKLQYQQQFDHLFKLFHDNDPRIAGQSPFFIELAKASYHTGNIRTGIDALKIAMLTDPSNELELMGMLCDLYYYLSRQNATVLPDVAACLKRQYQLDKNGPNELSSSPGFWNSYSLIQQDLGKYNLSVAAMVRARDASASLNEGGPGQADANIIRVLAKAARDAKDLYGSLEVVAEHMDTWKELAYASKMPIDVVADTWHDAALTLWELGKIDQVSFENESEKGANPLFSVPTLVQHVKKKNHVFTLPHFFSLYLPTFSLYQGNSLCSNGVGDIPRHQNSPC